MTEKTNLFQHAKNAQRFPAGQVILDEGEAGDFMYGIQSGEVQVILNGKVLYSLSDGDFFGEMALIDKGSRSARVVALTDCMVVPINEERFENMIVQTPAFALHVMRVLVARLRFLSAQF